MGIAKIAHARHRGHANDRARALLDHDGCHKLGGDQNTFDVDLLNAIPVFERCFFRPPYATNACIDLHDVDTTEIAHNTVDSDLHRLEVRDVSLISDSLCAERFNFLFDFLGCSKIEIKCGHRSARTGHGDGASLTDTDSGCAGARTQNQSNASLESFGTDGKLRFRKS